MLLSSLFVLIGAILVPSDYFWMYSTHIVLMCLYLIITKRIIVFFFTLLSCAVIFFSEFQADSSFPFEVGQTVYFNAEEKILFMSHDGISDRLCLKGECFVNLRYFSPRGEHEVLNNIPLISSSKFAASLLKGSIIKVAPANKDGVWWERNLYIERQLAQLDIQFLDSALHTSVKEDLSLRNTIISQLDSFFYAFSSWRFSKALLLGEADLWSERDTWMIRTLGLAHLFVVSGLHTGFMFAIGKVISSIFWRLSPNRVMLSGATCWHFDALVIIPLLFFYAYLTGWGEPVVRATIMLSIYLCSRIFAVQISAYSIVTTTLWLVLLIEPRSILSASLWLSFSMVYLLIGFSQTSKGLSRLFGMQMMLSTASMVLVLGWQSEISSVSILVNIILISFTAFIWFPLGLMSCVEVFLFASNNLYTGLAFFLDYILLSIEWVVYSFPLLTFETFSSSIPRVLMLCLLCYWVYQSPLKRGWGIGVIIWCALFVLDFLGDSEASYSIVNKANNLALLVQNKVELSNSWSMNEKEINTLNISPHLEKEVLGNYILSPRNISQLSPNMLLNHNVDWVILMEKASEETIALFTALQIHWLVIKEGESLMFDFQNDQVKLRHSFCIYSFFLFKSDTCRRVEKFESVLNYMQT